MSKTKWIILVNASIFILCGVIAGLFYFDVLLFNNPSVERYPVRGVDVSSYQGDIDWDVLSRQGIAFAFIKATEGSAYVDKFFKYNLDGALETGLRVGAYHFFSFDSPGLSQAENFISVVPKTDGMLPPVVDVEFYSDKEKHPPEQDAVRYELNILLNILENHYGHRPIIYTTEKVYAMYLSGHYETYDIWIRSVYTKPKPLVNQTWTFWQYTSRKRLDGYTGAEKYIDMNVFNGAQEEFERYGK